MWETGQDLAALQSLLDRSRSAARSRQLLHIFRPDRALGAEQVVALFPDRRVAAVATATAKGEPRVAPVDVLMVRGRFQLATPASTARAKHLRTRPAISVTYFDGDDVAVIAHGNADVIAPGHREFADADAACRAVYGSSALDWSDDQVYVRVEADTMFAMAREPQT